MPLDGFPGAAPAEPPEAKASSSQKPCAWLIALAVSEKVAVPLSAATTK
jgi:hypothetical protein